MTELLARWTEKLAGGPQAGTSDSPPPLARVMGVGRQQQQHELLVSFSTGFTSTADDSVNAERAAGVGMEMQIKLDGQSVTSTMDVKSKIKALSSLRKSPLVNEKKMQLDSLKLFN